MLVSLKTRAANDQHQTSIAQSNGKPPTTAAQDSEMVLSRLWPLMQCDFATSVEKGRSVARESRSSSRAEMLHQPGLTRRRSTFPSVKCFVYCLEI